MLNPEQVDKIITHPKFIGLWTYRSHGLDRRFCCSVLISRGIIETDIHKNWTTALLQAHATMEGDDETA